MQTEKIKELLDKFESACYDVAAIECWSARELQEILGYARWENFEKVIFKAEESCKNAEIEVLEHFREVTKTINMPNGAKKEIKDLALTRYACYLVAQNGDASKNEIAFAQTYFAVQTRKQEIIEQRLLDIARISAREKLSKSEKKLSGIIYERGVNDQTFANIRSKGDNALFGGFSTLDMKKKLGIAESKPLADFLPTLTLKAKDFAAELTSHNVTEKDLKGEQKITKEHIDNNLAVRKMLLERGVKPENLPPAEDISKVKRRLESEENKVEKDVKKIAAKNKKYI